MVDLCSQIEARVHDYFAEMRLPARPTVYDHLLLALREKDVVATFNWDPLLVHAFLRNRDSGVPLPQIRYLHGNVAVTQCPEHGAIGFRHPDRMIFYRCPICREQLKPSKLLFPVENKNYTDDPFITQEWDAVERAVHSACSFTIFGYGGPRTDVEARRLLRKAWRTNSLDQFNHLEVIERPGVTISDIGEHWEELIFQDHLLVENSFYDSMLGRWPRRSGEAKKNASLNGQPSPNLSFPRDAGFSELYGWIERFVQAERSVANQGPDN